MKVIRMSKKELRKGEVIIRAVKGDLSQKKASQELNLSLRQVKRLCKRCREEGVEGIAHRNRGRASAKKISARIQEEVLELIQSHYHDFGPQLIKEQLEERHQLYFSREWIRRLMIKTEIWEANKRTSLKVYQRRNRRSQEGELVQIDGSPEYWFEDRGPKCCLINMVDDATGKIKECRFVKEECLEGYFSGMKRYIETHGYPLALYSDRPSIFKSPKSEEKPMFTQFGRAMKELGIKLIYANSPQAKGRVERSHSTLQDRLIKMMRLDGISTIEEGNEYLKEYRRDYNQRFGKAPRSKENAHREFLGELELSKILCRQEKRKVSKSLEVRYKHITYQLLPKGNSQRLIKKEVILSETEEGLVIEFEGKEYEYKVYQEQAYEEPVIDRKNVDAFLDRKKAMSSIEKHRRKISINF